MATIADITNVKIQFFPTHCCAKAMFKTIGCGTPFTGKIKFDDDGEVATMVDNTFCYCLHPSPIPCFMCCGVGPCAMAPRMKKVSETRLEGTGESIMANRCCAMMLHDKGDVIEFDEATKRWTMKPGNSPAYPPCLHNTTMGYIAPVAKPGTRTAGAPEQGQMQR